MNWKKQLTEIEKDFGYHRKRDWMPVVNLVDKMLTEYPNNVELNIRAIYILHNILVEEEYHDEDIYKMTELLQKWFNESKKKFSENTEYLFFIGKILHIAEWYFGLEDNKLALKFQKEALEKEPGNLLYEWTYRLSCGEDVMEKYLAHLIIVYDGDKISWLKKKGFPGEYVLEHLKMSNKEYLKKTLE